MASRFIIPNADVGAGIVPSDGALMYFYATGTNNPKQTFTTESAGVANSNPVVADGNGVFPPIWLTGVYRVILKDKNLVQSGFGVADPVVGVIAVSDFALTYLDDTSAAATRATLGAAAKASGTTEDNVTTFNSADEVKDSGIASTKITDAFNNRVPRAIGAGAVDAITAVFSPAVALTDHVTVIVRALGANTTATPTFAPNGLTAKTIVKLGGTALVAGEIRGADHELLLTFNSVNDEWELMNPTTVDPVISTGAVAIFSATSSVQGLVATYRTGDNIYSSVDSYGLRVYATGAVTVSFDQYTENASSTSYARILKNGSLVQEWTTSTLTPGVARTIDISVIFGDILLIQTRWGSVDARSKLDNLVVSGDRIVTISSPKSL